MNPQRRIIMEQNYVIVTDTACDLAPEMLERLGIPAVPLNVFMKDAPALPCALRGADFYQALRDGQVACTSAANLSLFRDVFTKILQQGKDILYISLSSALSCMHATGQIAAEELREEYPDRKIIIIDSLSACMGEGLLVYYAAEKREAGMSLEELAEYVTNQRLHTIHWFTVDDLMFLRRGGRVGSLSAMAGTLLGIKPIMYVTNEGKLTAHAKVRGRKNSLLTLAAHFKEDNGNPKEPVFIAQADAMEDAEFLKDVLQKEHGVSAVTIGEIGPVIGAHAGPGTIALFYMGTARA